MSLDFRDDECHWGDNPGLVHVGNRIDYYTTIHIILKFDDNRRVCIISHCVFAQGMGSL